MKMHFIAFYECHSSHLLTTRWPHGWQASKKFCHFMQTRIVIQLKEITSSSVGSLLPTVSRGVTETESAVLWQKTGHGQSVLYLLHHLHHWAGELLMKSRWLLYVAAKSDWALQDMMEAELTGDFSRVDSAFIQCSCSIDSFRQWSSKC